MVSSNNSWLGLFGSKEYTYYTLERSQTYFSIPTAELPWFTSF